MLYPPPPQPVALSPPPPTREVVAIRLAVRDTAEIQPRSSSRRDTAEIQPSYSRDVAEMQPTREVVATRIPGGDASVRL